MSKEEGFARIYENNVKIVYRYIYSRLFDKSKVEDFTSRTFEIAWNKFRGEDMEELDNPKTWLIQIARNVMGNYIQKKKVNKIPIDELQLPDDEDPLLQQSISEEKVEQIKSYFEKLEPQVREILMLKIWEGYKFREIAEITDLTKSNVKYHYYAGLKKIRETMKDKEREKREYAVVIAGLSALKSTSVFTPSNAFVKTVLIKISKEAAKAAGSNMSKLLDRTVNLFGKDMKVKQVLLGAMVIVGVGAMGVGVGMLLNEGLLESNVDENTQEEEEQSYDSVEEIEDVQSDSEEGGNDSDDESPEESEPPTETPPVQEEEEEPYVNRSIDLKYWDEVVKTLKADMPKDAVIEEDGTITEVRFENSVLKFSIPHISFDKGYSAYEKISNPNIADLYRVHDGEGDIRYITGLQLSGTCSSPDGNFESPCGPEFIKVGSQSTVIVEFEGFNEDIPVADKIISTLQLVR